MEPKIYQANDWENFHCKKSNFRIFDFWILSSSRVVLILSMDSTKPTHHVYVEADAQHRFHVFLRL